MDVLKKIVLALPTLIFWMVVSIRNTLFNLRLLPSTGYDIPVINVGNLSTGGTAKTPHVDMIASILGKTYKVALVSRGYGRYTKGYREVDENVTARHVGDEPRLLKDRHPDLIIAIDQDKKRAIKKVREAHPDIQVIVLDDAFQYRWINPGLNLLLTSYHLPYTKDHLLPLGNLREPKKNAKRADIIIFSKTPQGLSPIDMRIAMYDLDPLTHQSVFFSYFKYNRLIEIFPKQDKQAERAIPSTGNSVLLVTGIAAPHPLQTYLEERGCQVVPLPYKDHHWFTGGDLQTIRREYEKLNGQDRLIITTEKDATRLRATQGIEQLKDLPLYYIEISVEFHESESDLRQEIMDYVQKDRGSYRIDPNAGKDQSLGTNGPLQEIDEPK